MDPVFQTISIGPKVSCSGLCAVLIRQAWDMPHWLHPRLGSLCQKREGQSHRALRLYWRSVTICPGTTAGWEWRWGWSKTVGVPGLRLAGVKRDDGAEVRQAPPSLIPTLLHPTPPSTMLNHNTAPTVSTGTTQSAV